VFWVLYLLDRACFHIERVKQESLGASLDQIFVS